MTTFHKFNFLPWELRNMIWCSAVRPKAPGAQFFSLCDLNLAEGPPVARDENRQKSQTVYYNFGQHGSIPLLDGPTRTGPLPGDLSWSEANRSAYLVDAGLWTACHESREVMLRHYRPEAEREKRLHMVQRNRKRGGLEDREKSNAPLMTAFTTGGTQVWNIVVLPTMDLFCFRAIDDWRNLWLTVSLIFHGCTDSAWHTNNLALEFDPTWDLELNNLKIEFSQDSSACFKANESTAFGCFLATCLRGAHYSPGPVPLQTLWIIDYRLRPTRAIGDIIREESPEVFEGNGCRYVEVPITTGDSQNWKTVGENEDRSLASFLWDVGDLSRIWSRDKPGTCMLGPRGFFRVMPRILACCSD